MCLIKPPEVNLCWDSCLVKYHYSVNRSIGSRLRQAIIPLYLALTRSYWKYPVQFLFPPIQEQQSHQEGQGLEHVLYKDMLGELGLSSLEKGRLGRVNMTQQQLSSPSKQVTESMQPGCACSAGQEITDIKWNKGSSDNIRKNFFTIVIIRQWTRLPKEAVQS